MASKKTKKTVAVRPAADPKAVVSSVRPHNFTHTGSEVLILRRGGKDRKSYGGFLYPAGVGATCEPQSWNTRAECGDGLHGWPWAFGLGEGQDFNLIDDLWLVLGAKPEDVVGELNGGLKCKCQHATIRYEGAFGGAMDFLRAGQRACINAMAAMVSITGNEGASVSRDDDSKLAASGNDSNLAASGNDAILEATGENCVASISASNGRVKIGAKGAFALAYWTDADGWRFVTGKVGENGVKKYTWYRVDSTGQVVEA